MPYVPSRKTDGVSSDRDVLNKAIELVAEELAGLIHCNFSLIKEYEKEFSDVASRLDQLVCGRDANRSFADPGLMLAKTIFDVAKKYKDKGAFLGELNYAITRLIQRVPQIKVARGEWKDSDELRYWVYAATVEALLLVSRGSLDSRCGIGGVFEDVKDEYKRRVNTAYEAVQIVKNGDCYDAPYYTRLVEVVNEHGEHIGHQEIMLRRSEKTRNIDILPYRIVVKKKK